MADHQSKDEKIGATNTSMPYTELTSPTGEKRDGDSPARGSESGSGKSTAQGDGNDAEPNKENVGA
ncbi:MAG: hypothetical protein JWM95_1586 [Gemmatimonadetes bacterium]|nr:hypothetical protein [Gemmatimonadota bacterium]